MQTNQYWSDFINKLAHRFAENPADVEDFEQVGRIELWQFEHKNSGRVWNDEKEHDTKARVYIKNRMINHWKHLYKTKKNSAYSLTTSDAFQYNIHGLEAHEED